jgi:hypothetical protein
VRKTYDEWTDALGQTYRPGDTVAIATISGRSPQLVIAKVERINAVNSKGEQITTVEFDRTTKPWTRTTVPSCTVRCKPLVDARDFYRSGKGFFGGQEKEIRSVTYQIPENIIKVEDQNI